MLFGRLVLSTEGPALALEGLVFFAKGAAVGFAIAAPVGPVGILCVRRTLIYGRGAGLVSGLGAATADAIYGCIAAFGITLISGWLLQHETLFRLVGGAFLAVLGMRMVFASRAAAIAREDLPPRTGSLSRAFGSTFVLTLTNPITIAAFLGIFAAVGIGKVANHHLLGLALVAGVFFGSGIWWLILAGGAGALREWLTSGAMVWINRISGAIMLGFAIYAVGGLTA